MISKELYVLFRALLLKDIPRGLGTGCWQGDITGIRQTSWKGHSIKAFSPVSTVHNFRWSGFGGGPQNTYEELNFVPVELAN